MREFEQINIFPFHLTEKVGKDTHVKIMHSIQNMKSYAGELSVSIPTWCGCVFIYPAHAYLYIPHSQTCVPLKLVYHRTEEDQWMPYSLVLK